MHPLRSIVYVSTAIRLQTEEELEFLLVECRRLNAETRTTGVLLYSGGTFMQCFEAPQDTIQVTYDRIRASARHKDLIELVSEDVGGRTFEGFHMGYKPATQSELLRLSAADWIRRAASTSTDPSAGMHLLRLFWSRTRD